MWSHNHEKVCSTEILSLQDFRLTFHNYPGEMTTISGGKPSSLTGYLKTLIYQFIQEIAV